MARGRSSEQEARDARKRFRETVANAVGVLRSQEVNRSFASFSLEEAVDQQIERIEGRGTPTLPSLLTYVDRVRDDLAGVIEGIKETDPALFRASDPTEDVNTPRDEDDV